MNIPNVYSKFKLYVIFSYMSINMKIMRNIITIYELC